MPPIQGFLDILRSNGANIAARTNDLFLQRLVAGVQRVITLYDTNAAVSDKVHALDDVMIQAAFWLTSKKPRTVPKAGKAATTLPEDVCTRNTSCDEPTKCAEPK